ncbi:glyceraldehyde 3-phosphate dehydrogenase NAD-binding domain-containing protein [Arenibacter sp. S6351L]|uniref:type I glyceraldehyde-3-phosphate dehydrogenase n=1 Tax=Arenibacter sp. S6351L TaxID=2926407 RepID=UPI001FF35873|nr:glyceraldehyde 3-phosphate dehydrogenase NAD-binding domain-containing protein [Arenibacter sp. S6351L]MCK0135494.1 type I glyceraldehyde-3-phosphate dehydrogenase [Arenibacter sp. S6351L]|tara:strand:+ start:508 stop:1503 length:996 start_codon:yes stop_codon:yes gene_type:complete
MNIAINGMGRIGRAALKVIFETDGLELVAVNDIVPIENIIYLIKYDSVYGIYDRDVSQDGQSIIVDGSKIKYSTIRNPEDLPWKEMEIDLVIESTGLFTSQLDAEKHIKAGAITVVISAPSKSNDTPTVVHGVNSDDGKVSVFSCASCTTNNISPVVEILGRRIGIKKAIMTTVHAYTASQTIVDGPSKKNFRMGRAGATNLVPTTTGAAIATTRALPEYTGKFDGVAIRTPIPVGSISDLVFVTEKPVTVEEVNAIFEEESRTDRYSKVLTTTRDPLVSSDIVKSPYASTIDLGMTRVVDGDLLKVMTWYDNEWGFTNQMIRQILEIKGN